MYTNRYDSRAFVPRTGDVRGDVEQNLCRSDGWKNMEGVFRDKVKEFQKNRLDLDISDMCTLLVKRNINQHTHKKFVIHPII